LAYPQFPQFKKIRAVTLVLVLVMPLLFILLFPATAVAAGGRTVVIDPGHGGQDPGAVDEVTGYLSHLQEGEMPLQPTYQQLPAEAFAKAVNNYLERSRVCRETAAGYTR